MSQRIPSLDLRWLALLAACSCVAFAQPNPGFNTDVPGSIMQQFRDQRANWATNVWIYANQLFALLAVIEFAWSAAVMLLEKSDLQSWTSALVRKMMWLGAFYAVLLFGNTWIPAIIDSFTAIGQNASGVTALSPGDVFAQGLQIAGALLGGASTSAFFLNPGPSLALVLCALLIVVSYVIITINFIVTFVESYLLVSVGFIFLGFGGSRWTAPYVERFIGLAVAIGVKILLLYCLISAGMNLGLNWIAEAQSVSAASRPLMTAFDVMGAAVIFMMLCWQIPKLFAGVLGGAPNLTGGDLAATVGVIASAALAAGSGVGGGAAAAGVGAAGGNGGTSSVTGAVAGVGSAKSAGTAAVAPPSAPASGAAKSQPNPPSQLAPSAATAVSHLGGQLLSGSGFESERPAAGFGHSAVSVSPADTGAQAEPAASDQMAPPGRGWMGAALTAQRVRTGVTRAVSQVRAIRRRGVSDAAPSVAPPRMPIDHEE